MAGGGAIAIDYPLTLKYGSLRDPAQRRVLIAGLKGLPFDNLWLRVSGFGADTEAPMLRRYIAAAVDFQQLDRPIVADGVGGLAAVAVAAFGAAGGISHGLGEKERFAAGETRLLVATTVIEVGVDVPAASVMVIEHAERFGLAQLHQLRGRVGRGQARSTCLLLYQAPLGETARARLQILRETEDGFRIAEEDLKLRGAGELLGTRQSGLPDMRLADLAAHAELLQAARDDARLIVDRDPDLESERGGALRALLYLFRRDDAVRTLRAG